MSMQFQDPRGEYSRQCPYCLEYITVDHLNRIFCPVKNGIKDFCKNRFKRLKNNLMKNGIVLDKPESRPLKIAITQYHRKKTKTIDDSINDSMITRNKKILESIIGQDEFTEIELNMLLLKGYDTDLYDYGLDNPRGIPVHRLGHLTVSYLDDEKVYITYFKYLSL